MPFNNTFAEYKHPPCTELWLEAKASTWFRMDRDLGCGHTLVLGTQRPQAEGEGRESCPSAWGLMCIIGQRDGESGDRRGRGSPKCHQVTPKGSCPDGG